MQKTKAERRQDTDTNGDEGEGLTDAVYGIAGNSNNIHEALGSASSAPPSRRQSSAAAAVSSGSFILQKWKYMICITLFFILIIIDIDIGAILHAHPEESTKVTDDPKQGLRAIVTGLEHTGTTIVGRLLLNAPCVIGAYETGFLLAAKPKDIESVMPWYLWNLASTNLTEINYRLSPADIDAMKNATNFMEMYEILRHRSYLFHELNDEDYCEKPYQMIDKTPRYIHQAYFEQVLIRTPGVPVIVLQKPYEKVKESWGRRNGTLTQEMYNKTFSNVWEMKKKYLHRIMLIDEENVMRYPDAVMTDVFHHVGLQWKSEYLNMTGLLKKFASDAKILETLGSWKFTAGKHSPR